MNLDSDCPEWRTLQTDARLARSRAWAPYSRFQVGAAVLTIDGRVIVGCNVENASFGLTICAERVAISAAIAQGLSGFAAICVSLQGTPVPCGACRQFLMEFNPDMLVLLDDVNHSVGTRPEIVSLADLLPRAFRLH